MEPRKELVLYGKDGALGRESYYGYSAIRQGMITYLEDQNFEGKFEHGVYSVLCLLTKTASDVKLDLEIQEKLHAFVGEFIRVVKFGENNERSSSH